MVETAGIGAAGGIKEGGAEQRVIIRPIDPNAIERVPEGFIPISGCPDEVAAQRIVLRVGVDQYPGLAIARDQIANGGTTKVGVAPPSVPVGLLAWPVVASI